MFTSEKSKVISIEDTSELNIPHKNWVRLVTRAGYGPPDNNGKRYGEVTMFDLLKTSMRQRPDYVIVGEVRGEEASILFQGMASGHPCMGTIHAESLEAMIERLITPPISLPSSLVELIDVVTFQVFATSIGPNSRRTQRVVEIQNIQSEKEVEKAISFEWDPFKDEFEKKKSRLLQKIAWKKGVSENELIEDL
jgi:flagellar protein FlaI